MILDSMSGKKNPTGEVGLSRLPWLVLGKRCGLPVEHAGRLLRSIGLTGPHNYVDRIIFACQGVLAKVYRNFFFFEETVGSQDSFPDKTTAWHKVYWTEAPDESRIVEIRATGRYSILHIPNVPVGLAFPQGSIRRSTRFKRLADTPRKTLQGL